MPGKGGWTDGAPGDNTSLSYVSVVISAVETLRSSTNDKKKEKAAELYKSVQKVANKVTRLSDQTAFIRT